MRLDLHVLLLDFLCVLSLQLGIVQLGSTVDGGRWVLLQSLVELAGKLHELTPHAEALCLSCKLEPKLNSCNSFFFVGLVANVNDAEESGESHVAGELADVIF